MRDDDGEVHALPAAEVRALQPGHLHQPAPDRRRAASGCSAGQPLADCSRRRQGELALGQNVLVRLHVLGGLQLRGRDHPVASGWCGTTSSPRSTSRSTRSRRATPSSGPEEITRDIPNVGEEALRDLDENGIIRVGAEVQAGRHPGRQDHAEGRDRADGGGAPAAGDLRREGARGEGHLAARAARRARQGVDVKRLPPRRRTTSCRPA